MTLQQQIKDFQAETLPSMPEHVKTVLFGGLQNMVNSFSKEGALKVGDKIPAFSLNSATGGLVTSINLLKEGPIVISFYRGGWCPYCNLELKALQNILPEIKKLGGNIVAISPELPDNSLSTQEKNDLKFPVLSDTGNLVAQKFGLEVDIPKLVVELTKNEWDMDVAKMNGTEKHTLPVPATYVIGQDGIVKYAFVDADYSKRAEPSEILEVLKSL